MENPFFGQSSGVLDPHLLKGPRKVRLSSIHDAPTPCRTHSDRRPWHPSSGWVPVIILPDQPWHGTLHPRLGTSWSKIRDRGGRPGTYSERPGGRKSRQFTPNIMDRSITRGRHPFYLRSFAIPLSFTPAPSPSTPGPKSVAPLCDSDFSVIILDDSVCWPQKQRQQTKRLMVRTNLWGRSLL